MKILGDIRPYTNQNYTYTVVTNAGKHVKVNLWQIYHGNKLLTENGNGIFKFGINTASLNLKLVAKVRDPKTDKLLDFHINIQPLVGIPKILDLYWQDVNGAKIQNREVAYLDKITLVVKTQNIPQGDTLKVTIYEDEYADGHGDSSRNTGTYFTKGISKNGYAYLEFNNMSLYQKKLNTMDYVDEDIHEFYAHVHYYNKLDDIKDGIQLKVKNELKQMVQPNTGNKPVVVGKVESVAKKTNKVSVTFNMFFDGTMNNMNNTTKRINKQTTKKDASYLNFYSNVALLYMTLIDNPTEHKYKIYTEGIGTYDNKSDQPLPGGATGLEAPVIYQRGIVAKVQRGIAQMKEKREKYIDKKEKEVEKATINVFGFSRGAAAARHFVSTYPAMIAIALGMKSAKNITFNFVGVFDTVAAYGLVHINDVWELGLDLGATPNKILQLAAADEYRSNFKLTDIASSIKAGVGYQLTMPGVHSDIGGGYEEKADEIVVLKEDGVFENYSLNNKAKIEAEHLRLKSKYVQEGWYLPHQITSKKTGIQDVGDGRVFYNLQLVGTRTGITNTYQYISFEIMRKFSEKYAKMGFNSKKLIMYSVDKPLVKIRESLVNYAISHDGSNASNVTLAYEELKSLRNKYLHRSNQEDGLGKLTMGGRYDDKGNPDRDILEG